VVGLGELEGLLARADLGGDAVQFVVEDVAEPLGEDQRQDEVLNLGASCAPRMLQAASQIQVSSDLPLVCFLLAGGMEFGEGRRAVVTLRRRIAYPKRSRPSWSLAADLWQTPRPRAAARRRPAKRHPSSVSDHSIR
jgi:hypothetical protein